MTNTRLIIIFNNRTGRCAFVHLCICAPVHLCICASVHVWSHKHVCRRVIMRVYVPGRALKNGIATLALYQPVELIDFLYAFL
jgi:hypothetical protein